MLKIEFEGTDGAGKTTGLKYFIEQARKLNLSVVETREVGNPLLPVCVELRELVLFKHKNLSGEAQELIFSAMRFENDKYLRELHESENPPNLMVSDRGWFSHLAYTDHNVSKDFTKELYSGLVKYRTLLPNVVIYFEVNTETALQRRKGRGGPVDVIEMKGIEFQEKVRSSFDHHITESYKNLEGIHVYHVDANQDINGVQKQLDTVLQNIITINKP